MNLYDIVVFNEKIIGEIKEFGVNEFGNFVKLDDYSCECSIRYIRKATEREIKTWYVFTKDFKTVSINFCAYFSE